MLKNENRLSVLVHESLVQSEQQHEAEEHPGSREEVPDVVVVVEVEHVALLVVVARLGSRALKTVGRVLEEI